MATGMADAIWLLYSEELVLRSPTKCKAYAPLPGVLYQVHVHAGASHDKAACSHRASCDEGGGSSLHMSMCRALQGICGCHTQHVRVAEQS